MPNETETKYSLNYFDKGMYQDSIPSLQPKGTYREAWNAILETHEAKGFGLTNEGATELCAKIPSGFKVRGHHFLEERDWHILFMSNGSSSEIGYVDTKDCTYSKIIDDSDIEGCNLDFGETEWIPIESKTMQPCNEVNLYWSNGMTYKKLNIDNVPEDLTCDEVKLFQCNCTPRLEVDVVEKGGQDLLAGAYMYGIQLEDEDGNTTNVFETSKTVYAGSENNRVGDISDNAIRISVSDLPENYSKVNIYVISHIGGHKTAKLLTTQFYNTDGVEYYHRSKDEPIRSVDLAEILIKKNQYIRGKDLIQYGNRLFLYNVNGEVNLDYQERAFNIKPKYRVGRVKMKDAHKFSGLRPDEVYSVVIWWNFCDGTRTKAYHIRNSLATKDGLDESVCDCEAPWIYGNNARRTQLFRQDIGDIQEDLDRGDGRSEDSYRRFVPEVVESITEDDYATPNVTELSDAASSGGEGGDDCNCHAIKQLEENYSIGFDSAVNVALWRGNLNQVLEALKAKCNCDEIVYGPRETGATLREYTDEDYQAIADSINAQSAVIDSMDQGVNITASDVEDLLQFRSRRPEGETGVRGSKDCGNDGGEEPPQVPSTSDHSDDDTTVGDTGSGEPTDPVDDETAGTRSVTPTTEEPESEGDFDSGCGDGVSFDGEVPDDGYGNDPVANVNDPDDDTFRRHDLNRSGTQTGEYNQSNSELPTNDCEPEYVYADDGCTIIDVKPCIYAEGIPAYWESEETYPLTKNCDGDYIYGEFAGKPIQHIKMPSVDIESHFVSYGDGVPNVHDMDNEEVENSFAHFLWLSFEDIEPPSEDELPKPLCDEHPFTIGIAPRYGSSKSVAASGMVINTFQGEIHGDVRLYPRHVVNSPETVDRYIEGDDGLKRVGSRNTDVPAYIFHSPDTAFDKPNLNSVGAVNFAMDIFGTGYRHGLYAEGDDPDNFWLGRKNRRGARSSMYLNRFNTTQDRRRCMKSADYALHDSILGKGDEFTMDLVNKSRESSVYFETDTDAPEVMNTPYTVGGYADGSFIGDVSTHESKLWGSAMYATMKKYRPKQYGSLVNAAYVPLYQGTKEEAESGICHTDSGDSFINLYSVKRTSYISDRVGEDIKAPFEYGGGLSSIKIFGNLLKNMLTNSGAGGCGTVPESGDLDDPRNRWQENGLRPHVTSVDQLSDGSTKDEYFPSTSNSVITFPVNTDINLGYRGSGDSKSESTKRDLNGQNLDSSFINGEGAYENSWLDRFYSQMDEISDFKKLVRVIANLVFTYVIGIWFIVKGFLLLLDIAANSFLGVAFTNPITVVIAIFMALAVSVLGFLWIKIWENTDLDNRFIDSFLNIDFCAPDRMNRSEDEFWMRDSRIRGLEDNYIEYNFDFSYFNSIEANFGLPDPYNTCPCLGDTTNEVLFSNAQNPQSFIDAYRNFKVNNFREIPAHNGPLSKMFVYRGRLYAQTTDMIFDLRSNRRTIDNNEDIESILLESANVIFTPIAVFEGPEEGRGGNKDPNALRVTPFGVIFIDREARDLYLFNGGEIKSIIRGGMASWMKENLFFDSVRDNPNLPYTDEKYEGSVWYDIGYDPRYERMLITKHDNVGDCDKSFTISYYFREGRWISFHNYIPDFYAYDRYNMFSFKDGGMWRHNSKDKFQTFYGEKYPFIIEHVIRDYEDLDSFQWKHTVIDTECYEWLEDQYHRNHKITFDKLLQYNSYQSTGINEIVNREEENTIDSISEYSYKTRFSFMNRKWRFNEAKDHIKDYKVPLFSPQCEVGPRKVNESNLVPYKDGQKNKFHDNYLANRLIFSKFDDKQLLIKYSKSVIESKSE